MRESLNVFSSELYFLFFVFGVQIWVGSYDAGGKIEIRIWPCCPILTGEQHVSNHAVIGKKFYFIRSTWAHDCVSFERIL